MLDLTNFDYISLIKRLSDKRICESHTLRGIIAIHLHELGSEFSSDIIVEIIEVLISIRCIKVKKYPSGYVDYDKWKLNMGKLSI